MKVIERAKGTIRFALKKPMKYLVKHPNEQSLIYLHLSYGLKRFKYSTGYNCAFNDWDVQKQRVRNKAHILNRSEINDHLNRLEHELGKELSRLDSIGETVTMDRLRAKMDEVTNKLSYVQESSNLDLFGYYEFFLNRKKGKVEEVTLRSYKQTKKLIQRFNPRLDFKDIDYDFHDNFVSFLEEDGKTLNTINKHFKNLKVVLNAATKDGYNTNLKYSTIDFKVGTEQTTAIYLDEEEIQRIHELDLAAFPKLERARDIFLIGCYTGQRVSDYNGLMKEDIHRKDGIDFFKIKQKKTGKEVLCPITNEIKDILETKRNGGNPPLKMNEQDINFYIKEVGRKAKIKQLVKNTFTRGGKKVVESKPKFELIGTHTARRSFCTNLYKRGMSPYDIMHFSGHSTEREFYKYIRIEKEERAVNIAKSGFFNLGR